MGYQNLLGYLVKGAPRDVIKFFLSKEDEERPKKIY